MATAWEDMTPQQRDVQNEHSRRWKKRNPGWRLNEPWYIKQRDEAAARKAERERLRGELALLTEMLRLEAEERRVAAASVCRECGAEPYVSPGGKRFRLCLKHLSESQKGNRDKSKRDLHERKRQYILSAKDRPCADCGGTFVSEAMHFDHVPARGPKRFGISSALDRSWEALAEEIAKCDVVCANCHAARTISRRTAP